MDDLKYFLVGGAVRDQVLKRENSDRDYVVVGANEEQMLERGFRKSAGSFPVFLHPDTGKSTHGKDREKAWFRSLRF